MEGRSRAVVDDTVSGDAAEAGNEFQTALSYCVYRCLVVCGAPVQRVFDLFRDVSHETIGFETTLGILIMNVLFFVIPPPPRREPCHRRRALIKKQSNVCKF